MTDIVTKVSIGGQVVPIGGGSEEQEVVYLTQAEYDALPASKLTDGKIYKIKTSGAVPGGSTDASNVEYDNTTSGLTADNVQDAIDETNSKVRGFINFLDNIPLTTITGTGSHNNITLPEGAKFAQLKMKIGNGCTRGNLIPLSDVIEAAETPAYNKVSFLEADTTSYIVYNIDGTYNIYINGSSKTIYVY